MDTRSSNLCDSSVNRTNIQYKPEQTLRETRNSVWSKAIMFTLTTQQNAFNDGIYLIRDLYATDRNKKQMERFHKPRL